MLLEVSLFGDCFVRVQGHPAKAVKSTKQKALIALLICAPHGRRNRSFLQDTLWGETCFDGGRQSLRRTLSDLRRVLGETFDEFFILESRSVAIRLERVHHLTSTADGEFMEGVDIPVDGFETWLRTQRLRQAVTVGETTPELPVNGDLAPRIAVIPFGAVSGGGRADRIGDWFAADICRSLSRTHFLAVTSHLSARELSTRGLICLTDVRARLAVDYVLTGHLRFDGERAGIDVDLIDAKTGQMLGTRTFQGRLSQSDDMRCAITADIVDMVGRLIVSDIATATHNQKVADIDSHRLTIAGVTLAHAASRPGFERGRLLLQEAVRRAPRATEPLAWLAKWHVLKVLNGWADDSLAEGRAARALVSRSLEIDPCCSLSLTIDGLILSNMFRELGAGGARYRQALDANPNEALAWLLRGMDHTFRGDGARGVEYADRAFALSPLDPFGYFFSSLRASAYLANGDCAMALRLADRSIAENPLHLSTLRVRIAALHGLDRRNEARLAVEELLKRQPSFTVESYKRFHPSAEFASGQQMIRALTDAGVPIS